jgi:hypothetical protein
LNSPAPDHFFHAKTIKALIIAAATWERLFRIAALQLAMAIC